VTYRQGTACNIPQIGRTSAHLLEILLLFFARQALIAPPPGLTPLHCFSMSEPQAAVSARIASP